MSNNTTQVTTLLKDPGYPWCLHAGNKSLSQFLDRVTKGIVKAAADLLLTIDPSDLEWLHTTKGHFHFYLPPGLRCVKAKIARKKYKQFPWYGEEVLIKAHLVKNEQRRIAQIVLPPKCEYAEELRALDEAILVVPVNDRRLPLYAAFASKPARNGRSWLRNLA